MPTNVGADVGKRRGGKHRKDGARQHTSPREKLVGYLAYAAKDTGHASEDAIAEGKCYPEKQAYYSVLWYFRYCLHDDLDPSDSDRFSPLVAAYLGDDRSGIIDPARIPKPEAAEEDRLLDECFPQDRFPLNKRQRQAVHKALHYPVSLIKGPPGTGKTETILHIAALALARGECVAAVSTNKSAVVNIDEKLDAALKAYGDPLAAFKADRGADDLMFSAACKHVRLGDQDTRSAAMDPVTGSWLAFDGGPHVFACGETISGWEQNKRLREFAADLPFITSTIHSLKKCFVDGASERYDLLIMDEASQTTLPVGLLAMSCAKRVVIVGDEMQLPPVVTEVHMETMRRYAKEHKLFEGDARSPYDISREGLSFLSSCYEVFSDRSPELLTMLNRHYRCHPAIIRFSNEEIYDRQLKIDSHPSNADTACPIRICWYEGDYREGVWPPRAAEEENPDQKLRSTYINRKQLLILEKEEAAHLRELAKQGKSICILSPFRGQIYQLRYLVKKILSGIVSDDDIAFETTDSEEDVVPGFEQQVYTLTIHRSQGQEFDAVYFLPVEDGNWEWPWSQGMRLVNVAVTRAKEELIVVLSTKLMDESTQRYLADRVANVVKPAKAADDKDGQEMYVRKLVEYVRRLAPARSPEEGVDPFYGFHRSMITSIFDAIPFKQNPKGNKGFATEECLRAALPGMDLTGVSWAHDVSFDDIRLHDGTPLSSACADRYTNSNEVHYDFVAFDEASRRILMAVEVDGAQHRFMKESGRPDERQRRMDETKNMVSRDICGAALCWLGPIHSGSLPREVEDETEDSSTAAEQEASDDMRTTVDSQDVDEMEMGEDPTREYWPSWKRFPSKLDETTSFVFLRIPTDGSTFWETDELQKAARARGAAEGLGMNWFPPTIEEYIRRQIALGTKGDDRRFVYLVDGVETCTDPDGVRKSGKAARKGGKGAKSRGGAAGRAGEVEGTNDQTADARSGSADQRSSTGYAAISLTKCLEEWKRDPDLARKLEGQNTGSMNRHLLNAGYHELENGEFRHRRPSEMGRRIGIVAYSGNDEQGRYDSPAYTSEARTYIAQHLDEILEA